MDERELPGVQRDSTAAHADGGVLPARVLALSDEGEPGVREVQPDLVVAPGHEVDLELRRRRQGAQRPIRGDRRFAARRDARPRALLEDRELELAARRPHVTLREGPVRLLDRARAERGLEQLARLLVEREEHGTRHLAIQSMHGQRAEALSFERFRQREPVRAGRRHAQEAGRLVGDEDVLVGEEDRDRRSGPGHAGVRMADGRRAGKESSGLRSESGERRASVENVARPSAPGPSGAIVSREERS